MKPIVSVEGVTGGYGDIIVLRDVTFSIAQGELVAIVGRNGAGKTTLLRILSGLNKATRGSIVLDGKDVASDPIHARIRAGLAYVQEGKRIFKERTVEENLRLGPYALKLGRSDLQDSVDRSCDMFPALGAKRRAVAGTLSGGQQQMLAIAQALSTNPRILMLDEPSTGLAPSVVADVFATLDELREGGMTVIVVEQSVDFVLERATKALVMNLGRLVYDGAPTGDAIKRAVNDAYLGAELS